MTKIALVVPAVLGAATDVTYGESATILAPGDTLLLYTDGVSEALDSSERLFTEARLEEVVRAKRHVHLPTVLTRDEVQALLTVLDGAPRHSWTIATHHWQGPRPVLPVR